MAEMPPADDSLNELSEVVAAIDREVAQATVDSEEVTEQPSQQTSARYVIFSIEETPCAAHLDHVLEVQQLPQITRLPGVPSWIWGVANLRGDIISVIDLREFLGLEPTRVTPATRIMVVKGQEEAIVAGMVVDEVRSIRQLADSGMRNPSKVDESLVGHVRSIFENDDGYLAVLDLEKILASTEFQQFYSSN